MTASPQAAAVLRREELVELLAEDVPHGDLTTEALGIGAQAGSIRFAARGPMVVAAIEDAAALLGLAGVDVGLAARTGDWAPAGALLLQGTGSAASLHRGWKVAQTLTEIWSGVATAARTLVAAAREAGPDIAIACTRKTVPGSKALAVAAVKAGGATIHRLGLSETILVFPEHRSFLADADLAEVVRKLRAQAKERKLVVEVNSVADGRAAAEAGFDVIQAEKFSPEMIAQLAAVRASIMPRPVLAAAGGITPDNAADYARAGADILVSSWPYTARPMDVAVEISATG